MWLAATVVLAAVAAVFGARAHRLARRLRALEAGAAAPSAEFLISSLNQELRAPLTAMLAHAEIAQQPSLEEERRTESLTRMIEAGRRLVRLVQDVFDLARLHEGTLGIHPVDCRLDDVLDEVTSIVRTEADRKGLLVAARLDDDVPQQVRVDPSRLSQLLRLVLAHAVKSARRGHVGARVELRGRSLVFDVQFAALAAGDGAASPPREGVELTLVRRLAAAMGGGFTLAAAPDANTCGTLELPFVPAASTPDPAARTRRPTPTRAIAPPARFRGRILVVEPGRDDGLLVHHALQQFGVDVEVVEKPELAADACTRQHFDLVLMDVPESTEADSPTSLRDHGCRAPMVALAARAAATGAGDPLPSGFDALLTKPLEQRHVEDVLARFLAADDREPRPAR